MLSYMASSAHAWTSDAIAALNSFVASVQSAACETLKHVYEAGIFETCNLFLLLIVCLLPVLNATRVMCRRSRSSSKETVYIDALLADLQARRECVDRGTATFEAWLAGEAADRRVEQRLRDARFGGGRRLRPAPTEAQRRIAGEPITRRKPLSSSEHIQPLQPQPPPPRYPMAQTDNDPEKRSCPLPPAALLPPPRRHSRIREAVPFFPSASEASLGGPEHLVAAANRRSTYAAPRCNKVIAPTTMHRTRDPRTQPFVSVTALAGGAPTPSYRTKKASELAHGRSAQEAIFGPIVRRSDNPFSASVVCASSIRGEQPTIIATPSVSRSVGR